MTDVEVHIDIEGQVHRVGTLYAPSRPGRSPVTFEYGEGWLDNPNKFSLEPALALGSGLFAPKAGASIFGSIGDSAPDSWGRKLMQRAERRRADRDGRAHRTLTDLDYLLGVSDVARLGAMRFRSEPDGSFQAATPTGVPHLIELGRLMGVTERIYRNEESDEDLQIIFAPGSSLGGARPKVSIIDQHGQLSIAKFAKDNDDYRIEFWESIALQLAVNSGLTVSEHELVIIAGKSILLSKRFDRYGDNRAPFLSALSMMQMKDGETSSYPELVDVLTRYGAQAKQDSAELYQRMILNVLISNVDDHLRNHGFLWENRMGWKLSPVYDLNPVPVDVKPRILSTNIDLDEGTCDIGLCLSVAEYFGLKQKEAKEIIRRTAQAAREWRNVAKASGATASEIDRMASAFEHNDLDLALAM